MIDFGSSINCNCNCNCNITHLSLFSAAAKGISIANFPPPQSQRNNSAISFAGGGFSINSVLKRCQKCGGKGAIDCPGCKGTGKNKKNGNIFERWKCFECQGFGLKSCPECGRGGLTPEQRGER